MNDLVVTGCLVHGVRDLDSGTGCAFRGRISQPLRHDVRQASPTGCSIALKLGPGASLHRIVTPMARLEGTNSGSRPRNSEFPSSSSMNRFRCLITLPYSVLTH
jgi:hypothetical protein